MKKHIKIYLFSMGIGLLCLCCKEAPKANTDSSKSERQQVDNNHEKPVSELPKPGEEGSFTQVARDFLKGVGVESDEIDQALKEAEDMQQVSSDSTQFNTIFKTMLEEAFAMNPEQILVQAKNAGLTNEQLQELKNDLSSLDTEFDLNSVIGKVQEFEAKTGELILVPPKDRVRRWTKRPMTSEEENWARQVASEIFSIRSMEKILDYEKMLNERSEHLDSEQTRNFYTVTVRQRINYMKRLAEKRISEFKILNPDLYSCEDVGQVYFQPAVCSDTRTKGATVYLPLGERSFADEVIVVEHPKNNQTSNYTLGEADAYWDGDKAHNIHRLGSGGNLTVKFEDNALVDVNGPDLFVFEMGYFEPTLIEISKDGNEWVSLGEVEVTAEVDIHDYVQPGERYYYVRLTNIGDRRWGDGASIDAVAAIGSVLHLNLNTQVLFDTGKSELKPTGITALKELAESINEQKCGLVNIEGHTDDVGDNHSNQELSKKRAASVAAELKKVIPGPNFIWKEKGYGESQPIVFNDSDENRAKNRRVEILVMPF